MKDKINLAVIGLGQRGFGLLSGVLVKQNDINIVGLCDIYEDRLARANNTVKEAKDIETFTTTDYRAIFDIKNLDAVLVSTAWEYHLEITVYALKKGVPTAMEVGGAYSEQELWDLVKTYEQTKTPFMFMENCCYNKSEMMAVNMAEQGLFGTVVHASGSYSHDLREEISGGDINRHYRLRNYLSRNCDNYPTHDIGPIAKLLNVNRGNKFVSLVSVSSKSAGLEEYINARKDKYPELVGKRFAQGDIVNTIITCAHGETVSLKLDTTLPRFYARDFTVMGTKGFYEQNANLVYLESEQQTEEYDTVKSYKRLIDNGARYENYLPEAWRKVTEEQLSSGHGGMDYFEFREFIECLKNGNEMPIDVYDAATWMVISILSEQSIAKGSSPIVFPDFTCGKWLIRKPMDLISF